MWPLFGKAVFVALHFNYSTPHTHLPRCKYKYNCIHARVLQSTAGADDRTGSEVIGAVTTPKYPGCCHIHRNIQETNCMENIGDVVLWEVSICLAVFLWRLLQLRECYQCSGQDAVVAIVGEPQWLALIPRAVVQTTSALVPLSLCGVTPGPRFPLSLQCCLPLLFPIHKENCNYGVLEITESCAELSSEGAFPTSVLSV